MTGVQTCALPISDEGTVKGNGAYYDLKRFGGPYIVSDVPEKDGLKDWQREHLWDRLVASVSILEKSEDEVDDALPARQLHWLIEGMFAGKDEADARLKLISNRCPVLESIAHDDGSGGDGGKSLFWKEVDAYTTNLLDAKFAQGFIDTNSERQGQQKGDEGKQS